MNDFLLSLSKNRTAKKVIKNLNLPIPLPQPLKRERGAWHENPLVSQTFLLKSPGKGSLAAELNEIITESGLKLLMKLRMVRKLTASY